KIARAARTSGGAGVITGVAVVKRELHELGHGEWPMLTDTGPESDQSFFTVTKTSDAASARHSRICASRPDGTAFSTRAASAAFDTGLRLICRITSPVRTPDPAAGPSGSTSVMSAPVVRFDGSCRRRAICGDRLLTVMPKPLPCCSFVSLF